jgi:hypothetical protein
MFLLWAAEHGHIPARLDIPCQEPSTTQQRRLDLLRRFATDTSIAIRPRAAACLHRTRPRRVSRPAGRSPFYMYWP